MEAYGAYYVQVNVLCFILQLIMYVVMNGRRDTIHSRQLTFNVIMFIAAAMSVSDIFAWLFIGKTFPGARFLLYLSNMVYFFSITLMSYVWLVYVNVRIRDIGFDQRRLMRLYGVPLAVMFLIIVTDPLTGWLFTVDENNIYSRSSGVILHWIVSYGYLVVATIHTVRAIRQADTKARRDELRPLLLFILGPIAAAAAQMLFYGLTTTQCGITVSIVIITMENLQMEITRDELTALNNRAAFERFVSERFRLGERSFSVLMCDVDRFKTINDTLGHSAGDLALRTIASVLREACAACPGVFLCRYGGDEFVFCAPRAGEDFTALTSLAEKKLAELEPLPEGVGALAVSTGAASGECRSYPEFQALLHRADESMYACKQARKAAR